MSSPHHCTLHTMYLFLVVSRSITSGSFPRSQPSGPRIHKSHCGTFSSNVSLPLFIVMDTNHSHTSNHDEAIPPSPSPGTRPSSHHQPDVSNEDEVTGTTPRTPTRKSSRQIRLPIAIPPSITAESIITQSSVTTLDKENCMNVLYQLVHKVFATPQKKKFSSDALQMLELFSRALEISLPLTASLYDSRIIRSGGSRKRAHNSNEDPTANSPPPPTMTPLTTMTPQPQAIKPNRPPPLMNPEPANPPHSHPTTTLSRTLLRIYSGTKTTKIICPSIPHP
jgi:hypothetical protein